MEQARGSGRQVNHDTKMHKNACSDSGLTHQLHHGAWRGLLLILLRPILGFTGGWAREWRATDTTQHRASQSSSRPWESATLHKGQKR
jgi:hypothetical protein